MIKKSVNLRESLKNKIRKAGGKLDEKESSVTFQPEFSTEGLIKQAKSVGLKTDTSTILIFYL